MNKIISLGIITILTTTALSGCKRLAPAQDQIGLTTTTASEASKTTQTYSDVAKGISFEFPKNWIAHEIKEYAEFNLNSDVLLERERDGFISYLVIPNAEKISLQSVFDKEYEDCLAGPEIPDFGRLCGEKIDLNTWKTFDVDGYKVYQSGWRGIPESGEMGKKTYIVANDFFVFLLAGRTGNTELNFIEKVLQGILDTIRFK